MTRLIALLGHPVAHSISPRFQQAALDALGVDARYEAWDTPSADLRVAVERLRSADVLGANVTIPHKEAALSLVDRLDPAAERVGALNTIYRRAGRLHGANTDVEGILRSLAEHGVAVAGAAVVLLGAGGAARAAVVAMREAGAAALTIANRTPGRSDALRALGGEGLDVRLCPLDPHDRALELAVRQATLVIHSTPLGMRHGPDEHAVPLPAEWLGSTHVAFDLVYVPERTPFIRAAEAVGATAIGGLSMLVHQGAASFRLWTGLEPPLDVMFSAARMALAEGDTTS